MVPVTPVPLWKNNIHKGTFHSIEALNGGGRTELVSIGWDKVKSLDQKITGLVLATINRYTTEKSSLSHVNEFTCQVLLEKSNIFSIYNTNSLMSWKYTG